VRILKDDSLITERTRNYKSSYTESETLSSSRQFVDVFPFELPTGIYQVTVDINDKVSNKTDVQTIEIQIPQYSTALMLSHIELATKISKAEKISNFSIKNNIEILPNPSSIYNLTQPVLYFYCEAYNLELDENGLNNYQYHYFISDEAGNLIRDFPEATKSTDTTTIAEASGMNIIAMAANDYMLNIEIKDNLSGESATRQKKFIFDKPDRKFTDTRALERDEAYGIYVGMDEAQLKSEFEKVKYIATSDEKDIFEELNVDGMRRFLLQFWKKRDPDPATPINEYKRLYFENISIANANYSTHSREGWKSDRGRVLLIYGRPDEIERNPSSIDTQPFEIWYYYSLEGGVEFVFADISGYGSFELLHSTFRSEISDPDWKMKLGGIRGFNEY
jgi:GWxTD domain-containing protein